MKAKELKDKMKVKNRNEFGEHLIGYYVFGEEEMAIFWSQLCKEQRKMCYESHWDMSCSYPESQFEEDNIRDAIVDAPEPKLD